MLIPHLIMNLQFLNIRGASLQGKSSPASPETICGFICLGNAGKFQARNLSTQY